LRDAADIADIAGVQSRSGRIRPLAVLARHQSARRADVVSRWIAIDVANRPAHDFWHAIAARCGHAPACSVWSLRRFAMREAGADLKRAG
jgi:2-octaprenyl-6-methoxyphenol hydroxylase